MHASRVCPTPAKRTVTIGGPRQKIQVTLGKHAIVSEPKASMLSFGTSPSQACYRNKKTPVYCTANHLSQDAHQTICRKTHSEPSVASMVEGWHARLQYGTHVLSSFKPQRRGRLVGGHTKLSLAALGLCGWFLWKLRQGSRRSTICCDRGVVRVLGSRPSENEVKLQSASDPNILRVACTSKRATAAKALTRFPLQ
jgi:hypothetical protein